MIFSRKRAERRAGDERAAEVLDDLQAEETATSVSGRGPYDISEAPSDMARLDLGSLHIPAIPDVEVRVQADQQGVVQQVVLVHGQNALQLGVFAAPRSEGIWDEVREEIRQSLLNDGAATREVEGEYGPELRAQVMTPDGPTDLRFVGIDGPRWMVRGVFQGAAAVDPAAAGPLAVCLEGLVVDRGQEAKPVREPLPLRLPREVADESAAANPDGGRPAEQPRQV
ncbi:DUF3710 domain-containing protein [Micromonospora sp. 15K316]|uniref:DUF3710 domain-containing protein n=1 Tax=Micromonospora sp. 15K316 TaxID=2530376 RepID=UPI00104D00B8|nr:DUF3710 domain-containing protein [Micromonospora sp. 15K316]TDC33975.1 DUF3710 domain-containing protein [Micromonospora sp. 15K316]